MFEINSIINFTIITKQQRPRVAENREVGGKSVEKEPCAGKGCP